MDSQRGALLLLSDLTRRRWAVQGVYEDVETFVTITSTFFRAKAVKIIDPDSGIAVGPNIVGEITYQSDFPMLGYLNHPEENERFFGKDGFLHSGDLGHYDEAGNLYFDGRLKELIKYKNFHLYPNELEELLMAQESVEVRKNYIYF